MVPLDTIDGRSRVGAALRRVQEDLTAQLGGPTEVTAAQALLIEQSAIKAVIVQAVGSESSSRSVRCSTSAASTASTEPGAPVPRSLGGGRWDAVGPGVPGDAEEADGGKPPPRPGVIDEAADDGEGKDDGLGVGGGGHGGDGVEEEGDQRDAEERAAAAVVATGPPEEPGQCQDLEDVEGGGVSKKQKGD
jgi:hypothetical protein